MYRKVENSSAASCWLSPDEYTQVDWMARPQEKSHSHLASLPTTGSLPSKRVVGPDHEAFRVHGDGWPPLVAVAADPSLAHESCRGQEEAIQLYCQRFLPLLRDCSFDGVGCLWFVLVLLGDERFRPPCSAFLLWFPGMSRRRAFVDFACDCEGMTRWTDTVRMNECIKRKDETTSRHTDQPTQATNRHGIA